MTFAYIAGFFDGEGHLYVRPAHRCFTIGMTQSVRRTHVLQEIHAFLGSHGITTQITPPRTRERRRPVQHLLITNACSIERFLLRVLPHLIVKKEQADAALIVAQRIVNQQQRRKDLIADAIADYKTGMSMNAVARKYHTSRQRLLPHFKKRGVRLRTLREAQLLFLRTAPASYIEGRRRAARKGNKARWRKKK